MNPFIIQNSTFIELKITGDKRAYFPNDNTLSGKQIRRIEFFGTLVQTDILFAPSGRATVPQSELSNWFVNISGIRRGEITRNQNIANLVPCSNLCLEINDVLSLKDCYISTPAALPVTASSVLAIVYYCDSPCSVTTEPTNAKTITIDTTDGNTSYKLRNYLDGFPHYVKRIVSDGVGDGLLTLRTFNGRGLVNIPVIKFNPRNGGATAAQNIYVDNLDIDTDNSFLTVKQATTNKITLTLFY